METSAETNLTIKPSQSGKSSQLRLEMGKSIDVSSAESKGVFTSVKLQRGDKSREAGSFVLKTFKDGGATKAFSENYKLLKSLNFPVLNTVREVEGEDKLLVSDLTEQGKKIVFSSNEMAEKNFSLTFPITNIPEVTQEITRIGELADENGLVILEDAYFIVIDPQTNAATVVLADLGPQGVFTSREGFRKALHLQDNREDYSREAAEVLVWDLESLQKMANLNRSEEKNK